MKSILLFGLSALSLNTVTADDNNLSVHVVDKTGPRAQQFQRFNDDEEMAPATLRFIEKRERRNRLNIDEHGQKPIDRIQWKRDPSRSIRHILAPAPNLMNPQIYPFNMGISMDSADMLRPKTFEFVLSNQYLWGETTGKSDTYEVDMDQRYMVNRFSLSLGVFPDTEVGIGVPLYHFDGENSMTQNGVVMINSEDKSRHFWGGATFKVKHLLYQDHESRWKAAINALVQLPEGNQRGRGGTTSGHWAIQGIVETSTPQWKWTGNFGWTEAGDLKLLNDTRLKQNSGWVLGTAFSKLISNVSAVEVQLHANEQGLDDTNIADFTDVSFGGSLGYRHQIMNHMDLNVSLISQFSGPVSQGLNIDCRWLW